VVLEQFVGSRKESFKYSNASLGVHSLNQSEGSSYKLF